MNAILERLRSFFTPVINVYQDRGFEPFGKTLIYSGILIGGLYVGLYKGSEEKVKRLNESLSRAKASAEFADKFNSRRSALIRYRARTINFSQKERWLYEAILASAKAHNITIESISSQRETKKGKFLQLSYTISAELTYKQIAEWIATIESSKVVMRITRLSIGKLEKEPGLNRVTMDIATVLAKKWKV